jgi:peptidyl-prolyl cis-trans isomerase C
MPLSTPRLPRLARFTMAGLTAFVLSGAAGAGLVASAQAQEALEPSTVLAIVNGHEITEDEAMMASQDFSEQMARVPADQRRAVIVDALIDLHLLAGAAEEAGLADTDTFARRMAYQRARTLRTNYLVDVIAADVNEETLRAAYDEAVAATSSRRKSAKRPSHSGGERRRCPFAVIEAA